MKSVFDWHKEQLTLQTVITDGYRNTQNVRRFFKQHIGEHFSFSKNFMVYMKGNVGKTLANAIEEWKTNHQTSP